MALKFTRIVFCTLFMLALVVFCAPNETESRRVIFHAPRQMQIFTGQILSSRAKEKPCEKCHMRDHRGRCRRILSFNADGIKC
ncbi:uncharacterized protein LOC119671166 [Teleopsis dalmanni]|uniref:uncharacterized protein LOC119671166 n=1 Tax=Teleopsis dalmanni TaxID=139649 RepID=UPI0018CDD928|nr:uncharacterized protein LOC119671166 [Teleopsis dalmanni]